MLSLLWLFDHGIEDRLSADWGGNSPAGREEGDCEKATWPGMGHCSASG